VLGPDGAWRDFELTAHALVRWRELHGDAEPPADLFVTAQELPPAAHLDMQAALQAYVDNAISKTIHLPADFDFAAFREVYELADARGLKGVTTFRPNPVTGEVLGEPLPRDRCCVRTAPP
jgi:ribonucleoside-diphosphate reductase alpha chain